jgi:hypothetical protein
VARARIADDPAGYSDRVTHRLLAGGLRRAGATQKMSKILDTMLAILYIPDVNDL